MMNVSFVPSIRIHKSIILIFLEKNVCLWIFFPQQKKFPTIFNFHFRENPHFCDEFQALIKEQWLRTPLHPHPLKMKSSCLTTLYLKNGDSLIPKMKPTDVQLLFNLRKTIQLLKM